MAALSSLPPGQMMEVKLGCSRLFTVPPLSPHVFGSPTSQRLEVLQLLTLSFGLTASSFTTKQACQNFTRSTAVRRLRQTTSTGREWEEAALRKNHRATRFLNSLTSSATIPGGHLEVHQCIQDVGLPVETQVVAQQMPRLGKEATALEGDTDTDPGPRTFRSGTL